MYFYVHNLHNPFLYKNIFRGLRLVTKTYKRKSYLYPLIKCGSEIYSEIR